MGQNSLFMWAWLASHGEVRIVTANMGGEASFAAVAEHGGRDISDSLRRCLR